MITFSITMVLVFFGAGIVVATVLVLTLFFFFGVYGRFTGVFFFRKRTGITQTW
jgi:hypothetical protein